MDTTKVACVDVGGTLLKLGFLEGAELHDRSRDLRPRYSGGVDWAAKLQPLLAPGRGVLAPGHDISPYLVAADLMITDHSSAAFEFLLRDKPLRVQGATSTLEGVGAGVDARGALLLHTADGVHRIDSADVTVRRA